MTLASEDAGVSLRAIELFSCSGGLAEGFRRAGIEFELAFDADGSACDSYERNLRQRPVQMDVSDLVRVLRALPPSAAKLDLLVADPPCTPWSRAGKRLGLADQRDQLRVTGELISLLKPHCWLVGNIPGLDDATHAPALQQTLGQINGYCIDYASLDAAAYGVPQHRVRPFWFGHPRGTPCIRWPAPTHGSDRSQLQIAGTELQPYVTVRDALQHLSAGDMGKPIRIRERDTRHGHPPSVPDRPGMTVATAQASNGSAVLLVNSKHPINRPDVPSFTVTTKGDCRGAQGACVMSWPWDRPGTTIGSARAEMSRAGRSGGRGDSQSANAIKLSERAGAVLQGLPEGWRLEGKTKAARWQQIGMAVPPQLAHAVAISIGIWFEQHRSRRAS